MEAFFGSWKVQTDKNVNTGALGKYFGWSSDRVQKFAETEYVICVEPTPNGFRCKVDYLEIQTEFNFQLGESFEYLRFDGCHAKGSIVLEGGRLLEMYTSDDALVWTNVREVNGSTMTVTTTLGENDGIKVKVKVVQELNKIVS